MCNWSSSHLSRPYTLMLLSCCHYFKHWNHMWFIGWLKHWNTCCCHYHTKLRELMVVVNDMQCTRKGNHDMCPCTCKEVCNAQSAESSRSRWFAHLSIFSGLNAMWMSILCQKPPLSLWHATRCLEGECFGIWNHHF